jgi:hypothetical protein
LVPIADVVLSQKLAEELKYEKEAVADAPEVPEFLKTFKEQGVWEVCVMQSRWWACSQTLHIDPGRRR